MNKAKKIIIISILSAILLLIIFGTCVFILIDQKKQIDIGDAESTLKQSTDYGQNYIDSMIFLGDKSMHGIISSGVLTGGTETRQVWSGKDGSLELDASIDKATIILPESGEEMLITQALEQKHPRYLVITVGSENGVAYCDKDRFTEYYKKLIDAVKNSSPSTNIILQSIFPVSGMYELKNPELTNEKIDKCNSWICELAEKENVRYLNTSEALKGSFGNLHKDYAAEDGMGLSAEGYMQMIAYIRTHGYTYPKAETETPTEEPTEENS